MSPVERIRAKRRLSNAPRQHLRDLLQRSEVADMDDIAIQRRFGELIGRAVFNPAKLDEQGLDLKGTA